MYAHELYEQTNPRIVVTYPGRFQPFHQGHAGVFVQLQKKFGAENVYILTSNDTSSAKSPFNFTDKYQLITAAGIPSNHVIETTSMYSLPDSFDPANTVFVTAVGAPDADRLRPDSFLKRDKKDAEGNIIKPAGSPGYYRTWGTDRVPQNADQVGYVIVIPEIRKNIEIKGKSYDVSHGTEARTLWNLIRNDEQARKEFLTQMYKQPSQDLGSIFDKIPRTTAEDIATASQDTTSPIHGGQIYKEAAGVGVIASKKQAKDPRYSMSLTKDVRPGAVQRSLRAFKLAEHNHLDKGRFVKMLKQFLQIAKEELGLTKLPKIIIRKHLDTDDGQPTFGKFENNSEQIYLAIADRHPVDVLRTLAHELTHYKQFVNGELYPNAGETGSPVENEAHAVAGVILRNFNKRNPDAIKTKPLDLDENFANVKKNLVQKKNEDYHPNDTPPGPETKPTMPPGTVRVDVSDVYDWYKLGMHISNLKGLGQHDFGQGPPSTIFSFGSEEEEHKYIKDLEKTGLTTTDIDPLDPNQPKDMPRQKVDPTYNVNEAFDQPYQQDWEKSSVMSENFADGRNPRDKGDSKRYNVPTKASISTLRKIAKQGGRKGQLAHWAANMKSGKQK